MRNQKLLLFTTFLNRISINLKTWNVLKNVLS